MSIKKTAGTAVVVGMLAAGVGAAGYSAAAAVTVPPVKACATSRGVLVLANGRGTCATGQTAVSIGAKGATGPAGPQGLTGPPGNGAMAVVFHSNRTITSTTRTLAGYGYSQTCTVTGRGTSLKVRAELDIAGKSGVTYAVVGPVTSQQVTASNPAINASPVTAVTDNFTGRKGGTSFYDFVSAGKMSRYYFDLTIYDDQNSVEQLHFRITTDGLSKIPTGEFRCMIEGTVIPT